MSAHDSFHTAWPPVPVVECQYAGLNAPVASKAVFVVGSHVQPLWSWVPPTATTYGEVDGHSTVGNWYGRESRCCLPTLMVPVSPAASKKLSCLARPRWNTLSNFAVCAAAAPPKVCSVEENDMEKTVPSGVAVISCVIALNRLG